MIGYILLLTGKRGRLICGSLQYDVFVGRANAFACESAMLKLKREVEMGESRQRGRGRGELCLPVYGVFRKNNDIGQVYFFSSPPPTFPSFTLAPTLRVAISTLPNLPLA